MTNLRHSHWINSRWTLNQYEELLIDLLAKDLSSLCLEAFECGEPGFWLRHDVELSLKAAEQMAQVEARVGVKSSYFVCVESPFFANERAAMASLIDLLLELEREVSFHIVLSTAEHSIEGKLSSLASLYPSITPSALTFHAPGVPADVLAAAPMGSAVYSSLAHNTGRYFSDSTGRWRWGDPRHAGSLHGSTVQLLMHPFWWSGHYIPRVISGSDFHTFLPQFATLERQGAGR